MEINPEVLGEIDVSQLPVVYLCQKRGCLQWALPGWFTRRYWLITPSKRFPYILNIRCPHHITPHILEDTKYGRTKWILKWADDGKKLKLPQQTLLTPLPTLYLGALRGPGLMDDVPDLTEFFDKEEMSERSNFGKSKRR